ncbi:MAG: flavoprotein [Thermoguttaceae bacterium]
MAQILLGITGGIAAYKSAILTSLLRKHGFQVDVIMTQAATELIGPKTFESLSGRPVRTSLFHSDRIHAHIELAREAELFCVAPATANMLGKAANGIADDLLSTTFLAFDGPILVAPAMNVTMWQNAAVQRNVKRLLDDGIHFIGPGTGQLSCGEIGAGRMAEPEQIITEIVRLLHLFGGK